MEPTWKDVSRAAFDGATPKARTALLRTLEHTIHQAAHQAVERALESVLHQVRDAGWLLAEIPGELPYAFQDAAAPGGPVTPRLQWMGSTSVLQQPPPRPLTAAQQRRKAVQDAFYAQADEAFSVVERRGFSALDEHQRRVLLLRNLEAEVNNGGFNQYFFNSAGDHAKETLRHLKAVGAHKTARLLERACACFPKGTPSPSRASRQKQLRAMPHKATRAMERLDVVFFTGEEDLASLAMATEKSRRRA